MDVFSRKNARRYLSLQINYPAESALGKIYKSIILNGGNLDSQQSRQELATLFNQLPEEERGKISEIAGQVKGSEMFRFAVGVQKWIIKKLESLPRESRMNPVFGKVYDLTVKYTGETEEMKSDLFWGEFHSQDNLVLLADALSN